MKPVRVVSSLLMVVAMLGLVGCATAPPREAIPPFREGVVIADQQTASAFADINSFLRGQQFDRAVRQPALTEGLFDEALDASDLALWRRAFFLVEAYAEKLERLLDPELRAGVEEELAGFGDLIAAERPERLPPGLAAAFTQLGGLLVQLHAERDAVAAVRHADPAIQDIFAAMMAAIGDDTSSGVRGTVWTAWSQELARIDVLEFRRATDDAGRRDATRHYMAVLEERQSHDLLLDSLRRALAQLAAAHGDIARGRPASAAAMIRMVQHEYVACEERLRDLRERRAGSMQGGEGR